MNIAFDAKRVFHNTRGLGNYGRDTIRLLSTYYPDHKYLLFNPSSSNKVDFLLPENAMEILPIKKWHKMFPAWWRSVGVCKQIKSLKADIYHGLSQELPWGIQGTHTRSVVTMHDAIFMRYPALYSSSYRAIFIQKNKYSCRVANRIIAISEQTKRDVITYFGADERKINVVYQGCNNIFRQPIDLNDKQQIRQKYNLPPQYLLCVGAIEKRKNAALIVEALHACKIDMPLVIVGKPTSYMSEIQELIVKYKLEHQVHFLHHAHTDDLPAIYAQAEIFIYPSFFEGFGIPILEALCTGTPVITSTGSCFEETGGLYSQYIDPYQPLELGDAIAQVLRDKSLRDTMIQEGKLFSEKFSDVHVAKSMMDVYNTLYQ